MHADAGVWSPVMIHLRVRWPAASGAVFAASALFTGCHSAPSPMTEPNPAVTPNILSVSGLVNRQVDEPTSFTSPSGNVRCYLDNTMARCDIAERSWAPPLRPASCELDYGKGIRLSRDGRAEFVCAGDTTPGAGAELGDGDSITAGTLRCESAGTGVTCRDTKTRHGFALSREAYHLF
jgi:hypothetical protein